MKKSIATLLVAILALGSVSAFALRIDDSATAIKKVATNCIKTGNMKEITDLLAQIAQADAKQQAVILNAIKTALNTATLKKQAPAAVEALNALGNISVTKAAGGKYNITIVDTDQPTGTVIKEDIPRAAIEKPTLSTDPTVNNK